MAEQLQKVKEEIGKFIVGQEEAIEYTLYLYISRRPCIVRRFAGYGENNAHSHNFKCIGFILSRIQFTPDLMPADITGTNIIERTESGKQQFVFQPGPIFSQMVLADEINRATPKTQSAILEAMGEKTVTF